MKLDLSQLAGALIAVVLFFGAAGAGEVEVLSRQDGAHHRRPLRWRRLRYLRAHDGPSHGETHSRESRIHRRQHAGRGKT